MFRFLFLLIGVAAACNEMDYLEEIVNTECFTIDNSSSVYDILKTPHIIENSCSLEFIMYWSYYYTLNATCVDTPSDTCMDNVMCEFEHEECRSNGDFYDYIRKFITTQMIVNYYPYPSPWWAIFLLITFIFVFSIIKTLLQTRYIRNQTRINNEFTNVELSPLT